MTRKELEIQNRYYLLSSAKFTLSLHWRRLKVLITWAY